MLSKIRPWQLKLRATWAAGMVVGCGYPAMLCRPVLGSSACSGRHSGAGVSSPAWVLLIPAKEEWEGGRID